ncbi:unnamed protein product [Cylicocyclus nassatus]|uniref:MSP domain-containing protein n=1 Tax=Cylicocyclus nassatus TaxID=53992 RepID=A0AA36M5F9_CYLNA|nr:unnamed protein product [Cylicocyclus nassatus]
MALITYPKSVVFDANGSKVQYTLINSSQTDLVYKLKCNNHKNYKFNTTEGFIGAGDTLKIEITRTKGPPGKDLFFLHYAVAPVGSKDPQEVCTCVIPIATIFVNMYAY